jgi:hypothetical protein
MEKNQIIIGLIIRFFVSFLIILFWMAYRIFYLVNDDKSFWKNAMCFDDKVSNYSAFVSYSLAQDLYLRDFLLIIYSFLLDGSFFGLLIYFILKGKSPFPIIHILLFVLLNFFISQVFTQFGTFDTIIDQSPGFISFLSSYTSSQNSRYFYSSFPGLFLVIALQFYEFKFFGLFWFLAFLTILEGAFMIVLRIQKSVDIIFGNLIAHYTYLFYHMIKGHIANSPAKIINKQIPNPNKIDDN